MDFHQILVQILVQIWFNMSHQINQSHVVWYVWFELVYVRIWDPDEGSKVCLWEALWGNSCYIELEIYNLIEIMDWYKDI